MIIDFLKNTVTFRRFRSVSQLAAVSIANGISFRRFAVRPLFVSIAEIASRVSFKHQQYHRDQYEIGIGSQVSFNHTIYV